MSSPVFKAEPDIKAENAEDAVDSKITIINKAVLKSTTKQEESNAVGNNEISTKKVSIKKERKDVDESMTEDDEGPKKKKRKVDNFETSGAAIKSETHETNDAAESTEKLPEPKHITSLESLGPFLRGHDNWKNYDYITAIPQICKDQPCMLGIDEAGRGPVLGMHNKQTKNR